MTKQQMIDAVRALGCSVQVLDGEIRVNIRGGSESTAYYTNDREDAVATARAMAERDADERIRNMAAGVTVVSL